MIAFHVRAVTHAKNMDVYSDFVGSAQNTRLAQNHAGILAILQYNAHLDATNSIFVLIARSQKLDALGANVQRVTAGKHAGKFYSRNILGNNQTLE